MAPLLECRRLGKRFGGVAALAEVDFTLEAGEIHGVVGSNGAGKSTLMKILAGALPDHDGQILLAGRPVAPAAPQAALALGIAMVYQELSGVGQLSVAENLFLGRQPTTRWGRVDWKQIREAAREHLRELEIEVDVDRRLDSFPLVIRQMVEIARGIHSGARVLILDEPTSALSPPETRRLFDLMRRLRARGVAIVFISHFLEDVLEVCDRVTVLRNGRRIETTAAAALHKRALIERMLGRDDSDEAVEETTLARPSSSTPVLAVENLTLPSAFADISLQVAAGECLGLYGFVGAGHGEVVQALAGVLRPTSGSVTLDARRVPLGEPHSAVRRGMVLIGGDRAKGLFLRGEVYKNITLPHLKKLAGNWLRRDREVQAVGPLLERVGCRPPDPLLPAGSLSGGNQQKAIFAKWLAGPVRVLLLEEPTRGMDVAAKADVMRLVAELKRQGTAVLLASAEPELLLAHADRILVMRRGRIAREFAGCRVNKASLMHEA